ncbi:hypothetical protein [Pedobacter aquae]|uniref:hypothetical protein n=1 Tax=Pedobacter aquae TaxID=2605747 RepID=UPI00143DB13A|nr:hypothetical protein [Pedobacter aquae]
MGNNPTGDVETFRKHNPSHHSGLWIKIYLDETTNIHQPCLPAGRQDLFIFCLWFFFGIHEFVPRFLFNFYQEKSKQGWPPMRPERLVRNSPS